MQQVLDQVTETWYISLIIVGSLAFIQLFNAGFSCIFVRWLIRQPQHRVLHKSGSFCGNGPRPELEKHKRSKTGGRQHKRRASADIAVSSTENMAAVMTSYCGTWSGRPPQHHVRFSSTIEVLPPSALLVSAPQDFSSAVCGGVSLVGMAVPSRTFGTTGVRLVLPAESKV
jgi:hypothetical protein